MSKTDKTKPMWVRMLEHKSPIIHDHTNDVCDAGADQLEWAMHQCHRRYWWYGCCTGCGCMMCNDQEGRRRSRRKDRHNAKRHIRSGNYEALGGRPSPPSW